jgi:heme-degrading monooxygenase HmoA
MGTAIIEATQTTELALLQDERSGEVVAAVVEVEAEQDSHGNYRIREMSFPLHHSAWKCADGALRTEWYATDWQFDDQLINPEDARPITTEGWRFLAVANRDWYTSIDDRDAFSALDAWCYDNVSTDDGTPGAAWELAHGMNTGSGEHSPGIGFAGDHYPLMSASVVQKYIVRRLEHLKNTPAREPLGHDGPGFDLFALRTPATCGRRGGRGRSVMIGTKPRGRPVTALGPREGPTRLPQDAEQILLVITFDVQEGDRVAWHDVWSRVRQYALEWPGCSVFRLGRSDHTCGQVVVMTTWASHEELNRFVRQSNILWIDRALDYHAHFAVFEMTPAARASHQKEPQLAAAGVR